jgi:hypothetical protein
MADRSAPRPSRPEEGFCGTSEGLRWRFRGNHEQSSHHSVFTQLRGLSIPQRAPLLNCSTMAYAWRARTTAGRPPAALADGRPWCDPSPDPPGLPDPPAPGKLSCPVSAASPASAPAAGMPAPAGVVATAARVVAAVVSPVTSRGRRSRVTGPPARAAARVPGRGRRRRRAARPGPAAALAQRHLRPPAAPQRPDGHEPDDCQHDHDDDAHGRHLLSVPPSFPLPRAGPRGPR